TRVNEQAILIRVSKDCLAKRITAFFFPVRYFKSECCFGNAINRRSKISAFVMKESFPICEEELQVEYLRRVYRWVVDLGYTTGMECVPLSAGSRICGAPCDLGA